MVKRKRDRQPPIWVTITDLSTAASHPFYRRLNQLLREHGFDDFAEGQCASFYAETMGRPSVPPGTYFRLLLIGYFEGRPHTWSQSLVDDVVRDVTEVLRALHRVSRKLQTTKPEQFLVVVIGESANARLKLFGDERLEDSL